MSQANPVFEKNYRYYLDEITKVDFGAVKDTLACRVEGDQLVIPFFGREYRVSRYGIIEKGTRGRDTSFALFWPNISCGVPPGPRPTMGGCRSRI